LVDLGRCSLHDRRRLSYHGQIEVVLACPWHMAFFCLGGLQLPLYHRDQLRSRSAPCIGGLRHSIADTGRLFFSSFGTHAGMWAMPKNHSLIGLQATLAAYK